MKVRGSPQSTTQRKAAKPVVLPEMPSGIVRSPCSWIGGDTPPVFAHAFCRAHTRLHQGLRRRERFGPFRSLHSGSESRVGIGGDSGL